MTETFNDNSRYVFIVFKNAGSALASTVIPTHRIGQKLVNVHLNEVYSTFINIDFLLVPPQPEAPTHILNILPDECLLDIFKFLEVKDLSNVADTCTKFRTIVKDIFQNQFSCMYYEPAIDEMDARTLARFLRNFGALMESYVLNCNKMLYRSAERYLELFCRHCAVPETALVKLQVMNYSRAHNEKFSKPIQLIISRLKSLALKNCDGLHFTFGKMSTGNRRSSQ